MQVVWAIRLVTIILAAVLFCWITGFDFDPLQIIHHTSQFPFGLGIAALTLYFCKQKKVI